MVRMDGLRRIIFIHRPGGGRGRQGWVPDPAWQGLPWCTDGHKGAASGLHVDLQGLLTAGKALRAVRRSS